MTLLLISRSWDKRNDSTTSKPPTTTEHPAGREEQESRHAANDPVLIFSSWGERKESTTSNAPYNSRAPCWKREASDEKSRLRQVHRQRWPCRLKKELAEGQLHKIQEKLQMTRESPEEERSIRWLQKAHFAIYIYIYIYIDIYFNCMFKYIYRHWYS